MTNVVPKEREHTAYKRTDNTICDFFNCVRLNVAFSTLSCKSITDMTTLC